MKKNTRKTRTLALTLALCLALVCFAPAALVCASTDLEPRSFRMNKSIISATVILGRWTQISQQSHPN